MGIWNVLVIPAAINTNQLIKQIGMEVILLQIIIMANNTIQKHAEKLGMAGIVVTNSKKYNLKYRNPDFIFTRLKFIFFDNIQLLINKSSSKNIFFIFRESLIIRIKQFSFNYLLQKPLNLIFIFR